MSKAQILSACHKLSREKGLNFNIVLTYYFLESILLKLSKSSFSDLFVLKGGFLLSSLIGVEERTTLDMDFLYSGKFFSEDDIVSAFNAILAGEEGPIRHQLFTVSRLKGNHPYQGYRLTIQCRLENINQIIPLDIATGDKMTPGSVKYQYRSLFGKEEIPIKAYPLETVLSEKIQTIYDKGFLNSRSKDFYDLYTLCKLRSDTIDMNLLLEACKTTFSHRKTEWNTEKLKALLVSLKDDPVFIRRWVAFAKKNHYASGLKFDVVIEHALGLVEKLEWKSTHAQTS